MSRRRTTAWVPAVVLLVAVAGCGGGGKLPSAVEQVPRLGAVLDRVDADLVAHRYAAARDDLRALKAAVVKARDGGRLADADAARILDTAARLMTQLPEPGSAPTSSPGTASSATASSSPTRSASSHPARPKSTAPKPSASPTSAPTSTSPTPSPAPSATSTGPTGQASPAAATATPSP
jgi:hypothetical protein